MIYKNNNDIKTQQIAIIIASVVSFFGLMYFLQDYIVLIAISAIMAYLFYPMYQWFIKKLKFNSVFAVTATLLALFVLVTIPLTILVFITVLQAIEIVTNLSAGGLESLSNNIKTYFDNINQKTSTLPLLQNYDISFSDALGWVQNSSSSIATTSVGFASSSISNVANFFTKFIIFIFVFISLLIKGPKIIQTIEDVNPLGPEVNKLYFGRMSAMTTAMVKFQFVIAILQGLIGTISLAIVGVDYLAFWFAILTFLSIIPLGGGIILIPFAIILLLTGNIWQGILLLAVHFLITVNVDNILRPKFVPKTASLDPALTLLSVFAGIGFFGFFGIFIGPVIMIVLTTTIELFVHYRKGTLKELEAKKRQKFSIFRRNRSKEEQSTS